MIARMTALAVLVALPAAAQPRQRSCPVDLGDPRAVLVEATVLAIHQPAYRCGARPDLTPMLLESWMAMLDHTPGFVAERPTATTGCALIFDPAGCATTPGVISADGHADEVVEPRELDVELDARPGRTPFASGSWRVCGLAPGDHVVQVCTRPGPLVCPLAVAAGATTVAAIERVEPTVEIRVDRVHRGAVHPGETLTVHLASATSDDPVVLRPREALAWAGEDPARAASPCAAPASPPGCARCEAGGSPLGALVAAGVVALTTLRRRRS